MDSTEPASVESAPAEPVAAEGEAAAVASADAVVEAAANAEPAEAGADGAPAASSAEADSSVAMETAVAHPMVVGQTVSEATSLPEGVVLGLAPNTQVVAVVESAVMGEGEAAEGESPAQREVHPRPGRRGKQVPRWKTEEEETLKQLVAELGEKAWADIAAKLSKDGIERSAMSCEQHWCALHPLLTLHASARPRVPLDRRGSRSPSPPRNMPSSRHSVCTANAY